MPFSSITRVILLFTLAASLSAQALSGTQVPYAVPASLTNQVDLPDPSQVLVSGWFSKRFDENAADRLLAVDLDPLLAGFRSKPGSHPWIGEHIGKWLHAATLAWANNHDSRLRAKLDRAVVELIKAQEPDGYLGTYTPDKRFGIYRDADWDVWSHKYCLIGLLTYYQYTGNTNSLESARKAADLLLRTFGPGKKSILSAGTHMGMAATSVLEPIVMLYRFTGDSRYLDFARYIVKAWEEPGGPAMLKTLGAGGSGFTHKTANGKAYEMLSNLVGLCDLAQVTGDTNLLTAALRAAKDVREKRLYITGSASQAEHFRDDFYLPNDGSANIAETCVTVTWIQLNSRLLQLTGEAVYGDELERSFFNHLAGAQHPDGREWCYYTPLEGRKGYGPGISCCVSSGPRGISLFPQHLFLLARTVPGQPPEVVVNLYDDATLNFEVGNIPIRLKEQLRFHQEDRAMIHFTVAAGGAPFRLKMRIPLWARDVSLKLPEGTQVKPEAGGRWLQTPALDWKTGEEAVLEFQIVSELRAGTHGNANLSALVWGPLVLAYDQKQDALGEHPGLLAFSTPENPAATLVQDGMGMRFEALMNSAKQPKPHRVTFVPYADAGRDGGRFAVWLPSPGKAPVRKDSIFLSATEERSRRGNLSGSIIDDDPATISVTFDGNRREEDWFAVVFEQPVTAVEIAYMHGANFHDGGWFDASAGKPRIQVLREKNGEWKDLGRLADYPETTATDPKDLKERRKFVLKLDHPERFLGVRVTGKPGCGDSPEQAFSSCAELQVILAGSAPAANP